MATTEEDARQVALAGERYHTGSKLNLETGGVRLTDEEVEAILEGFERDDHSEKTWTRRIVENYLMHYKWYFPRKDIPGAPSLAKAWAYFEHVTLPRHFTAENSAGTILRRSEPGEKDDETELYKPLTTRQYNLIEFGIGVDLYFSTVRMVCIMFLIAGFISISNIRYYYSAEYSGHGEGRFWALGGSAVCTQTYWAVCEDCREEEFKGESGSRFARAPDGTVLVLRNSCEIGLDQGIVDWATWLFFLLFIMAMSKYLRAREIRFDEDKLTASDYSVVIKNPSPDIYDPEEYRDFFSQFAEKQVTIVTIHLNNELMLRKLYLRRIYKDNLRRLLPKGTILDDEDAARAAVDVHVRERDAEPNGCLGCLIENTVIKTLRLIEMFLPAETLVDNVFRLTEEIKELQKEHYEVSKVYVAFETEEGQRAALTALSASKLDIVMNNTHNVPPSAVFHGRVLNVSEPYEPNAVRWLDQSATRLYRTLARVGTLVVTTGLIALAAFLENLARKAYGPRASGVLVSIFNSVIPIAVKLMMLFERHLDEGSYQVSLYLKITLFRWVNTAIILQIITPFTSTLGDGRQDLLPSISAILWAELWLTPALRLLDIGGILNKHILAPRAMTQEAMNLNFLGTPYNLGERYTDLTKVLFVCFFYSSFFPASFFFGFAILFVQYYTDKFCLLRIWGFAPSLGSNLARYSRRYFFTGALVAFVISSAYAWAQFPYDNVCDIAGTTITPASIQFFNVTRLRSSTADHPFIEPVLTVEQKEPVFYCAQGFRDQSGFSFPPKPGNQPNEPVKLRWMTDSQETLVNIYYWTVIAAVVIFLTGGFLSTIIKFFVSFFRANYTPEGASQKIDFSCNPEIVAYIPHVKLRSYPFPFLAANVDDLDEEFLGFTDTTQSLDNHNMMFDLPFPGQHRKKKESRDDYNGVNQHSFDGDLPASTGRPIFGIVKHYPPEWWHLKKSKKD